MLKLKARHLYFDFSDEPQGRTDWADRDGYEFSPVCSVRCYTEYGKPGTMNINPYCRSSSTAELKIGNYSVDLLSGHLARDRIFTIVNDLNCLD